jgi:predicted thioredoxin/glutaredoxin
MTDPVDQLQSDINAAREAYDEAHRHLVTVAGSMFSDGEDAAANLLAIAEEYGADQATLRLLEHAEGISPLLDRTIESQVADMADTVEQALERVLVAQDRLDLATAKRENRLAQGNPAHLRSINIGGREFVIDAQKRELRSVDVASERYELGEDVVHGHTAGLMGAPQTNELSLTEAFARESGVAQARIIPNSNKMRGR